MKVGVPGKGPGGDGVSRSLEIPLRACRASPSAGDVSPTKTSLGGISYSARKAVFLEGRAPRVRMARPNECPGNFSTADGQASSRWFNGGRASVAVRRSPRACGATPFQGVGGPRQSGLAGTRPGMARSVVLSGGRTLCVRKEGLDASQGMT